jgi:hypothetical protein
MIASSTNLGVIMSHITHAEPVAKISRRALLILAALATAAIVVTLVIVVASGSSSSGQTAGNASDAQMNFEQLPAYPSPSLPDFEQLPAYPSPRPAP